MKGFLEVFNVFLESFPNVVISTISGRYYAMDRDQNRDRVGFVYKAIVYPSEMIPFSPLSRIERSYSEGKSDEFLTPVCFQKSLPIQD